MRVVDLRSDTVTRPTPEMRERMASARVGDDVFGDDPTVAELQTRLAAMFGKQAALFFPSGTMCNLACVLAWCDARGSEVIAGDRSHLVLYEQAGVSQFGGVSVRTVPNLADGSMDAERVRLAVRRADDFHEPRTQLVAIENTHNVCGGTVLPERFLQEIRAIADDHSIPVHMDGARVWNALASTGTRPEDLARYVDSLSVCLSKGLGAPVGSVLLGPRHLVDKALRIRKALGGGMRQSGVLAAAGLQALDDFERGTILEDHRRATALADGIRSTRSLRIATPVETNIVFVDTSASSSSSAQSIHDALASKRIAVSVWGPHLIRLVVHRDVTDDDLRRTLDAIRSLQV